MAYSDLDQYFIKMLTNKFIELSQEDETRCLKISDLKYSVADHAPGKWIKYTGTASFILDVASSSSAASADSQLIIACCTFTMSQNLRPQMLKTQPPCYFEMTLKK